MRQQKRSLAVLVCILGAVFMVGACKGKKVAAPPPPPPAAAAPGADGDADSRTRHS
jgi:hypothetical protein